MIINRKRIFQLFKYTVYSLLTVNIYLFFSEEWAAVGYRFADGIAFKDIIEGFASSIDTAAWVVLLLVFELETYILDDEQLTPRVSWSLYGLRAICYTLIVYAFYGYATKLIYLLGATPLESSSALCALADGRWSYAIDLDEYVLLTASNCNALSSSTQFMQLSGLTAVVDPGGYRDIVRLAWVDVINAGVWLLVVLVLEIDVWLQERRRLGGTILRISKFGKSGLYTTLLAAAIYWGIKGDFVDFWDAFLWLVAFAFIELNVFEWRRDSALANLRLQSPAA